MSSSPHDALFKAAFSRPDIARSELELLLPPTLREKLDLASLTLRPGSFVDEDLRHRHSDLLYELRTVSDSPALVFVLMEHQSTFDAHMPFRLLRYAVRVWDKWLVDHPGKATKLPLLISVVLHHGDDGWRARPELSSMFDADPETLKATRDYVPHFHFMVDDIASLSLEALAARTIHVLGRLVQLAFWTSHSVERFKQAKPIMRELAATTKRDAATRTLLTQLYVYLLRVLGDVDASPVYDKLLEIAGPEGKEDVVTAGDQLIAQGLAKGLAEGRAKGLAEGQAKGLAEGRAKGLAEGQAKGLAEGQAKGLAEGRAEGFRRAISKLLAVRSVVLSETGRSRLEACEDSQILEQWYDRAITATTEDEIFA
ncbi:Rpn family recombination-promoting nuclease/putative transposase [Pendulispora rubella]|uniref:Rpn family recombination-promoting nuclease/putative transposase n=1 Tax=Pendulispora rubella TaxID=2741070 RepID=A0ABZ2LDD1_9BACT